MSTKNHRPTTACNRSPFYWLASFIGAHAVLKSGAQYKIHAAGNWVRINKVRKESR